MIVPHPTRPPLRYRDFQATTRFEGLTGLRALAAVAVVLFHYGGTALSGLQGWISVHVFFVLSGFLITTLALREESRRGRLSLRAFYLRRAFRILPLYALVLALTVAGVAVAGAFVSSRMSDALPYYLTFTNELVDFNTPYGVSWTLGVEEKFYLIWPGLLALTALCGRARAAARFGVAGGVLVVIAVVALPLTPGAQWANLSAHYASLMVGCLLALVLHTRRGFAALAFFTRPRVALLVALGFAVFQVAFPPLRDAVGGNWRFIPLYAVAAAFLVLAALSAGPVRRFLTSRVLVFVGERSYALYLTQIIAAGVTGWFFPPGIVKGVATVVVALGFACVLRRWVELPAIALGRRLSTRDVVPPTGAVAARG